MLRIRPESEAESESESESELVRSPESESEPESERRYRDSETLPTSIADASRAPKVRPWSLVIYGVVVVRWVLKGDITLHRWGGWSVGVR